MNQKIAFLTFFAMFQLHLLAEPIILQSVNGNKIKAEILSVTESKATVKRSPDGKTFDIDLDTLSPESVELVRSWLKREKRKPSQKLEFNIGDSTGRYNASVLVPKGEYNTTIHAGDTIRINFDTGQLQLRITGKDEKLSETLKILTEARASRLGNMPPSERKEKEPLMKLTPAKHGKFEGYLTENNGSFYGRFTSGDFMLEVNLRAGNDSPIEWDQLPDIISTISIVDAK
jgi:hypothetical protein